ncbi:MAG: polysaccharide pyruvyl transferase family protein [Fibrobacterota bacterium]|nr:polysaccharide pyruvyl transferase family protein [Fibrobacterota bacterium]
MNSGINKIGILTFFDGFNYGTYLQAYSMQKVLRTLGYVPEFINYKPWFARVKEYHWLLHRQRPSKWLRNAKKILHFRLAHSRLKRGGFHTSQRGLASVTYDAIIIGSDEVWNFHHPLFGYDPTYFSQGLAAGKILSYAATFGSVGAEESIPQGIREAIGNIDFLSVRDAHSLDLVRRITDKPVSMSLDPTLLHNFRIQARNPLSKDYILVYCTGLGKEAIRKIRELATMAGKRLLSIGYMNPWCDANFVGFDPLRFPGFFSNAGFVITNMFHGTVFSIKYNRPFCVLDSPYRRHKIGSFLATLGLEGRIIPDDASDAYRLFRTPIDYCPVNDILKKNAEDSLNYLKAALSSPPVLHRDLVPTLTLDHENWFAG